MDTQILADLHSAAFVDAAWSEKQIADSLALDTTRCLTAEMNGQNIGFLFLQRTNDEGEILTFCVHPDYQKQKIGMALLQAAIDFVRQQQGAAIFLEVAADNAACRLYEKAGFQQIGRRPSYYTRGDTRIDALTYRLPLFASGN